MPPAKRKPVRPEVIVEEPAKVVATPPDKPLTITVPSFTDRAPLIKRMSIFALVVLVLYYSATSFFESRDNHNLLNAQAKSINQVSGNLNRALEDLKQAREERAALLRIAAAQNAEIKRLGGVPVDIFTPGLDENGNGKIDPGELVIASTAPSSPKSSSNSSSSPRPGTSATPRASKSPAPKPSQSPKPSPTPNPIVPVAPHVVCTVPLLGNIVCS